MAGNTGSSSYLSHHLYRSRSFVGASRAVTRLVDAELGFSAKSIPSEDKLAEYHAGTARDIAGRFDTVPALRLKLWKGEGKAPSLTLTCSHAIYDGDSIRMLLNEASDRLGGRLRTSLPYLSRLPHDLSSAMRRRRRPRISGARLLQDSRSLKFPTSLVFAPRTTSVAARSLRSLPRFHLASSKLRHVPTRSLCSRFGRCILPPSWSVRWRRRGHAGTGLVW